MASRPAEFESRCRSIVAGIDARRDRNILMQIVDHDGGVVLDSYFLDSLVQPEWGRSVLETPGVFAKVMTSVAPDLAVKRTTLLEVAIPHRNDRAWEPVRHT